MTRAGMEKANVCVPIAFAARICWASGDKVLILINQYWSQTLMMLAACAVADLAGLTEHNSTCHSAVMLKQGRKTHAAELQDKQCIVYQCLCILAETSTCSSMSS